MYTTINFLKINYEILGRGDTILLLHGWGGSLESLRVLGLKLKDVGYNVMLIDLPGFGQSDKQQKSFSLDDYADIVEEFLAKQGIRKLYVFGHSFGGSVAIKIIHERKKRIPITTFNFLHHNLISHLSAFV